MLGNVRRVLEGSAQILRTASLESPLISVRDLRTYFVSDEGTTRAVDGASFDVHPGRTLGIVGETGCGKSVTARSILRIIERPGRIVAARPRRVERTWRDTFRPWQN